MLRVPAVDMPQNCNWIREGGSELYVILPTCEKVHQGGNVGAKREPPPLVGQWGNNCFFFYTVDLRGVKTNRDWNTSGFVFTFLHQGASSLDIWSHEGWGATKRFA